ncbi:uncharacterized protein BX664DRAFT_326740, partial [Halteromyces radiatus]|uniref:uncharacterized protein n=1 Tax=Halteromyces radiatus TaxID=101107 RepID=UPI00221EF2FD
MHFLNFLFYCVYYLPLNHTIFFYFVWLTLTLLFFFFLVVYIHISSISSFFYICNSI